MWGRTQPRSHRSARRPPGAEDAEIKIIYWKVEYFIIAAMNNFIIITIWNTVGEILVHHRSGLFETLSRINEPGILEKPTLLVIK